MNPKQTNLPFFTLPRRLTRPAANWKFSNYRPVSAEALGEKVFIIVRGGRHPAHSAFSGLVIALPRQRRVAKAWVYVIPAPFFPRLKNFWHYHRGAAVDD